VNAFTGENAEVVPPRYSEEFAALRTAKKVENKPGTYPDETENHEDRE
jgi:hypothetical protein